VVAAAAVLGTLPGLAEVDAASLEKARAFSEEKKYLSAYKLVQDAGADEVEAALLRQKLLREFYSTRIGGEMFALRDLEPDQTIEEVRGAAGTSEMFQLNVGNFLKEILKKHPDNPRVHRELGRHYFEMADDGDEMAAKLALRHLSRAVEGGAADSGTYFALGWVHLSAERIDESIVAFHQCIELLPSYAPGRYNLASALMQKGAFAEALPHALQAAELYEESGFKSDAHSLAGDCHFAMEDLPAALLEYEAADQLVPDTYPNIKSLLLVRLKTNSEGAGETASRLLALDPKSPRVLNDIGEVYQAAGATAKLVEFYQGKLEQADDGSDPIARGNLHFFLANLLVDGDPEAAMHWKQAWAAFKGNYQEDHPVFEIIRGKLSEDERHALD